MSIHSSNDVLTEKNLGFRLSPYIIIGYPFSVSCWFWSNIPSQVNQTMICLSGFGNTSNCIKFLLDTNRVGIRIGSYPANCAFSGNMAKTSRWHHACAVGVSSTQRWAYIDGGNKGGNTSSITPSNNGDACFSSGGNTNSGFSGKISMATVWNTALTDQQVRILAQGADPVSVALPSIVWHQKLTAKENGVAPKISRKVYSVNRRNRASGFPGNWIGAEESPAAAESMPFPSFGPPYGDIFLGSFFPYMIED